MTDKQGGGTTHPNNYRDERYIDAVTRLQKPIENKHLGVPASEVAEELGVSKSTAVSRLSDLAETDDMRRMHAYNNLHASGYRTDEKPARDKPKWWQK